MLINLRSINNFSFDTFLGEKHHAILNFVHPV